MSRRVFVSRRSLQGGHFSLCGIYIPWEPPSSESRKVSPFRRGNLIDSKKVKTIRTVTRKGAESNFHTSFCPTFGIPSDETGKLAFKKARYFEETVPRNHNLCMVLPFVFTDQLNLRADLTRSAFLRVVFCYYCLPSHHMCALTRLWFVFNFVLSPRARARVALFSLRVYTDNNNNNIDCMPVFVGRHLGLLWCRHFPARHRLWSHRNETP